MKERLFKLAAGVTPFFTLLLVSLLVLLAPSQALAYLGPGAGISAIGSIIAIIVAVIVAIFGFLWFPLKRMMRNKKKQKLEQENTAKEARDTDK